MEAEPPRRIVIVRRRRFASDGLGHETGSDADGGSGEERLQARGAIAGQPIQKQDVGPGVRKLERRQIMSCQVVAIMVMVVSFGEVTVAEPASVLMGRVLAVRVQQWCLGQSQQQTSDHGESEDSTHAFPLSVHRQRKGPPPRRRRRWCRSFI